MRHLEGPNARTQRSSTNALESHREREDARAKANTNFADSGADERRAINARSQKKTHPRIYWQTGPALGICGYGTLKRTAKRARGTAADSNLMDESYFKLMDSINNFLIFNTHPIQIYD